MKKLIATSSVLLGVVFLAGCNQQSASHIQSTTLDPAPKQTVTAQQPATSLANKTDGWQTYTSKLGYSFEYPKNWHCKTGMEKNIQYGDECLSESSQKALDEMNKNGKSDYFAADLKVGILNISIEEYMKDPTTQKIGNVTLDGRNAYDVIIGGYGANYGVVTDFNGKVLEIKFRIAEKADAGLNENHVLSTFKFTK